MVNEIFQDHVDLDTIIEIVKERGYHFEPFALKHISLDKLRSEAKELVLESGDHIEHPINRNAKNQVQQLHERFYCFLDDPSVPLTSSFCKDLSRIITSQNAELHGWLPNEIGFQRYRGITDWISPHRDRRSDRLFSITFTLDGQAWVNIYKSLVNPPDYKNLEKIDSFLTQAGTAMFLRAPGFGNGDQVIHEVRPPLEGSRLILNLRMRSTLLKNPKETHYE